jgi:CDP-glycerol glycerophosphotransferase (TagB/SpsB family)
MRKPVLFYQFDEKEYREKQYGEGFFDYKNTVLGKWTDEKEQLYNLLDESLSNGNPLMEGDVVRSFFPLWDKNNSQRIYEKIKSLKGSAK